MIATYIAPSYEQNSIIQSFRGAPRFGHSDDFSKLFSTKSSDYVDYTLGALFIGAFLMTIFFLWIITLLIFTFVGKEKVGFLSGYALLGNESKKTSLKEANSKRCDGPCCVTSRNVRLIFVFSCAVVIIVSLLCTFRFGFQDLKVTLDSIGENALEIREIAHEGRDLATSLETFGDYSNTLREIILPDLRYPNFCVNTALDNQTALPLNATRQLVVDDLEALGNFHTDSFRSMKGSLLNELKSRSENTWKFFTSYGIHDWQLHTFVSCYVVIASFMMITTITTWVGRPVSFLICTSTWFLLPALIVLVTLSWLLVSAFGIAAVMDADFCTGGPLLEGPDLTTLYILERSKLEVEYELLHDAASYWFNGCQSVSPFSFIDDYQTLLTNSMTSMQTMQDMMENATIAKLEQICGIVGDFDSIGLYFDRLNANFDELLSTSSQFSNLMDCETMNSIYVDAVHDSACTDFPEALAWTFALLLVVSFFGMMMITLRSAWLEFREKKIRLIDDLPIISIEKIQDLDDEQFNDSPSPKNHSRQQDYGENDGEDTSPLTDRENSSKMNVEVESSPSNTDHDPVSIYQSISVADEALQEIPSSPKDPAGYRVY